jgi:hypothetical protein
VTCSYGDERTGTQVGGRPDEEPAPFRPIPLDSAEPEPVSRLVCVNRRALPA